MARARKQLQIEGTQAQVISELDDAAEDYRMKRDERMGIQKLENEARPRVLELMLKHNLTIYKYEDTDGKQRQITLKSETTVKVNRVKDAEDDDGDDEVAEEPGGAGVDVS